MMRSNGDKMGELVNKSYHVVGECRVGVKLS
jgi:hypothetical protein